MRRLRALTPRPEAGRRPFPRLRRATRSPGRGIRWTMSLRPAAGWAEPASARHGHQQALAGALLELPESAALARPTRDIEVVRLLAKEQVISHLAGMLNPLSALSARRAGLGH